MIAMQEIYIPSRRASALKENNAELERLCKTCSCTAKIESNVVVINGDPFGEYQLTMIVQAFGRGFPLTTAEKLLNAKFYFSSIDMNEYTRNKKRILNMKARLIGREGRVKKHIEFMSSAHIAIFGNVISFIGQMDEIYEAETAARTIIEGGSHRLAYDRMAAAHRKNKNRSL